ncbi:hypothetical protein [Streptomyces sp. ODS05-4]|uniref:hypothetical protein n=1 Tax=Streptomyces sp. ODS05-4 TaxID=2944939 RepID=UPI00210EA6FD|nr:hypothetical protein [Streptomyces sp. ODS05-4]
MAFAPEELRVLRRALAQALHPAPLADTDVQDCLRLAGSVDEAVREAGRQRTFLLADLARYRAALPGAAAGYLELLDEALGAGHEPGAEDLAALRGLPCRPEAAALLHRCRLLAERSLRARLAGRSLPPGPRSPLHALPGGRAAAGEDGGEQTPRPAPATPRRPDPTPPTPPGRPVPKPTEVFPPRRRPAAPPRDRLAAG